jgi:MFS transporter, FSR family, fosmidomycin resistance protein
MGSFDQARKTVSNRILYVVSLNHFVNDGSTYLISSLFPAIIVAFRFSAFQIGILVAVGYLVNLVFQPLTGRYSERYEARKLLALGISLIAASMLLFTISSTFAMMLVCILILRFGSSFYHPVGVSAVSRAYTGSKLDTSMGFQSAFGNLGIVLAFIFSAPVYLILGWKGPFLIYVALELATVIITLFAMRSKVERRAVKESIIMKDQIPLKNNNNLNEQPNRDNSLPSQKSKFALPFFFVLAPFVSGGAYAVFGNFGNLLLYNNGFGLSNSNYLMATWVVSAFFGAILSGRMTRRLARTQLLALTFFIAGIAALGFAFSYHNTILAIGSLLINGFAVSITYPATYSELSAYLGEGSKTKGAAFGILFSSQIAGSSVLGFISGYLAAAFGLESPFIVAAILLVASVGTVLVWTKMKN